MRLGDAYDEGNALLAGGQPHVLAAEAELGRTGRDRRLQPDGADRGAAVRNGG